MRSSLAAVAEMGACAFAVSMARAGQSFRSTLNTVLSKRLFHSPVPSSRHPIGLVSSLVGDVMRRRPMPYAAVRLVAGGGAARLTLIRCRINRSGVSPYLLINSVSSGGSGDRPPDEMDPLFFGCDYDHWFVVMENPGGENATLKHMIDFYIKTLAKVVGSEEEATKKIYDVSRERYFGFRPECYLGFRCEIDEEKANKLRGLPGVLFVLRDPYVGAAKFVNGQIMKRLLRDREG